MRTHERHAGDRRADDRREGHGDGHGERRHDAQQHDRERPAHGAAGAEAAAQPRRSDRGRRDGAGNRRAARRDGNGFARLGRHRSLALGHGSYGAWSITGQGFAQGRTDVQVWVMDTTDGGWSTLEHQANLTTSTFQFGPCTKVTLCLWRPGGLLSATGAVSTGVPGGFGPYALHPLQCGRSYRPVAYDAVDGYVYGPTLSEACPVLH
jgi:hypothetical protein